MENAFMCGEIAENLRRVRDIERLTTKLVYGSAGGKDLSGFRIGVKVKHPKFGEGTIVNDRGVGSNMIVDIAFEGFGIKQLSASLAPLTIIG